MAKQTINIGSAANDGTGSTLREAFDITNDNFTELYGGTGGLFHKIEGTNFTGSLLIGHSTTGTLSSASNNTGVGITALDALTTGDDNVAVGTGAAGAISVGSSNVAIGHVALASESSGNKNVAVGQGALNALTHGGDAYNVAVGYQAGVAVISGIYNTLIGGLAGDALTTGNRNVAIGYKALSTEDGNGRNVAVGYESLLTQNAGAEAYNVAIGHQAGKLIDTGTFNTLIGGQAGVALTTGSNNTVIGYNAAASAVDVSNEVTIGNSSIANVRIPADSTLKIGASGDLQLEHLSSNSFIKNTAVGDLYIENQVDNKDIIFRSDDGSGGLATYFYLDGSTPTVVFSKSSIHTDNIGAYFGTGLDLQIYHNGTTNNSNIDNTTGDLYVSQYTDDGDIIFRSDDGSGGVAEYFRVDGGATNVVFSKDIYLNDDIRVRAGTGGDFSFFHNGSNSKINNNTGDIEIENFQDDGDIIFKSDDGSGGTTEYFKLDGSSKRLDIADSIPLCFGAGDDLQIQHNGSTSYIQNFTGNLIIENNLDDGDIIFKSDDGSGGTTEYFRVDGGATKVIASKNFAFLDNVKAEFGDSGDLQIYHDSNDSYIADTGTGSLKILATDFDLANSAANASMIRAIDGAQVELYYGGSKKFETTSAGVTVTGAGTFSGNVNAGTGLRMYTDGSGNGVIYNLGQDKDLYFVGDDGGTGINALVLDMSEGGAATFAGDLYIPNKIIHVGDEDTWVQFETNVISLRTGGADRLTLTDSAATFAGNVLLGGSDDYIAFNTSGSGSDPKIKMNSDASFTFLNTAGSANLTLDNGGNATFAGDVTVGPKSNATVQVSESGGATVKMIASSVGRIGTYTDDELRIVTDGDDRLTISNTGNATFAGGVAVEGGTLELGKADTASGHINAKELMTFNIDTDNDDTNRYFAWYKDSSSGSGTELLKILESGDATFAGNIVGDGDTVISTNTSDGSDNAYLSLTGGGANSDGRGARARYYGNEHASLAGAVDISTGNISGADMLLYSKDNIQLFTDSNERMRINSSGNVGIGTTSLTNGKLVIDSTANQIAIETGTAGDGRLNIGHFSNGTFIGTYGDDGGAADLIRFGTHSGDERMRITSGGDVLVGTTGAISTGNGLSINSTGQMRIGRASTGSIKQIIFSNSNDEVGSISTSGSATAFNTSSDYRLKEDLKDFDGLDKVSKIPVYDFKWKADESRSYGVLAHELQEVVPNAVNGEKDVEEMQGVDYSKVVPVLIKAIQELEARVKTLENK